MPRIEGSDFTWIKLPAVMDSLEPFRHFVLEEAAKLPLPAELVPNLELALEELLVNVITYAYPRDLPGMIDLGCCALDGRLFCIQVRDYGRPFNPLSLPEPDLTLDVLERPVGGLGIHLVRQVAELVHYEYADGSNRFSCCFASPL